MSKLALATMALRNFSSTSFSSVLRSLTFWLKPSSELSVLLLLEL